MPAEIEKLLNEHPTEMKCLHTVYLERSISLFLIYVFANYGLVGEIFFACFIFLLKNMHKRIRRIFYRIKLNDDNKINDSYTFYSWHLTYSQPSIKLAVCILYTDTHVPLSMSNI